MTLPPFAFRDSAGRVWHIFLTCGSVVRCEERRGVKILDLIDPEAPPLAAVERWSALAFILGDELRAAGVTPEELQESIRTRAQEEAVTRALRAAIERFLPETPDDPKPRRPAKKPAGTFHDIVVRWIFDTAAWCGVEPWDYTLRTLDMQASKSARIAGRSVNVNRGGNGGGSTANAPQSIRDIPRDQLARMFSQQ